MTEDYMAQVMQIPDEALRRYPEDYKTVGGSAMERRAFISGAEWARKEALQEAANKIARLYAGTDTDDYGRAWIAGLESATREIRKLARGEK